MSEAFCQVCICGRSFSDAGAFTRHHKTCQKGRKRLSSALLRVKEVYQSKKRRVGPLESETSAELHRDVAAVQETVQTEDSTTASSSGPSRCGPGPDTNSLHGQVLLFSS
jgi:hypothetical protein